MKLHKRRNIGFIEFYFGPPCTIKWVSASLLFHRPPTRKFNFCTSYPISTHFCMHFCIHKRKNMGCIEFYFGPPSTIKWASSPTPKTRFLYLLIDQFIYTGMKLHKKNIVGHTYSILSWTSIPHKMGLLYRQTQHLHLLTNFHQILYNLKLNFMQLDLDWVLSKFMIGINLHKMYNNCHIDFFPNLVEIKLQYRESNLRWARN